MAHMKITGLDEVQQKFNRLSENAENLSGSHELSAGDLFTESFMCDNTDFTEVVQLFAAGGFKVESAADIKAIPEDQLDKYIQASTNFPSWEVMLRSAVADYAKRQLFS